MRMTWCLQARNSGTQSSQARLRKRPRSLTVGIVVLDRTLRPLNVRWPRGLSTRAIGR